MEEMFCKSLFDALPFDIYVVDLETHEILYVNRAVANRSDAIPGRKCYEAICGGPVPASSALHHLLFNRRTALLRTALFSRGLIRFVTAGCQVHEKILTWQGNRKVKYHISIDTTELKETQNRLTEAHAELAIKNKELAVLSQSERVQAETALKTSEEKYRTLFETTTSAMAIIEKDTTISLINNKFEAIYGYSKEEVKGRRLWQTFIFPEDQKRMKDYFRSMLYNPDITPDSTEFRIVTRSGEVRHIHSSVALMPQTDYFITSQIDITEQKIAVFALQESEERFRQIFEQNEDTIILFEIASHTIINTNPAAERFYKHSRNELIGRQMDALIDSSERHFFVEAISKIREKKTFSLSTTACQRRNGKLVYVYMRGQVMRLNNNDVVYCLIRDITEQINMQQEIMAFQSKMISTNKLAALGILVSGIVHEINNPNNFIAVNSNILANLWDSALPILEHYTEEEGNFELAGIPIAQVKEIVPNLFDGLKKGSSRIKNIVANLKGFAKNDNGSIECKVGINQVILEALSIIGHQIYNFTDNFVVDLANNEIYAIGNHQQLEQVIINLVMNALQSLPDKQHGVHISTVLDKQKGIVVTVKDEGMGISKTALDKITKPFYSTRLKEGGTGLGLFISSAIINEHKGSMHFFSEPGIGTTVVVTLRPC